MYEATQKLITWKMDEERGKATEHTPSSSRKKIIICVLERNKKFLLPYNCHHLTRLLSWQHNTLADDVAAGCHKHSSVFL
jgi:hypothetical protein